MRFRRLIILAVALVVIAAAAVVVLGRTGSPTEPWRYGRYTHVQLNLCLSGRAACFTGTAYPAVVDDAVKVIADADARSAVLVEACQSDAEAIARRTEMRVTFATVLDDDRPLPCVDPTGRGAYGIAVLTRSAPVAVDDQPYAAQQGSEARRHLCVTTDADLTVCGTHLVQGEGTEAVQDQQCAELTRVVEKAAAERTTVVSGDLNRTSSCAPAEDWVSTDAGSTQNPGAQQAYGGAGLGQPRTEVVRMAHSDHDALVTTTFRSH